MENLIYFPSQIAPATAPNNTQNTIENVGKLEMYQPISSRSLPDHRRHGLMDEATQFIIQPEQLLSSEITLQNTQLCMREQTIEYTPTSYTFIELK